MTDTEKLIVTNLLLAVRDCIEAAKPRRFKLGQLAAIRAEREATSDEAGKALDEAIANVRALIA